jgi:hypothetical protein
MAARKKKAAKKKGALRTTRAVIGLAERAGRAVRRAAGKPIKRGTGALARSRAEVIEGHVRKAPGQKKKK